MLTKLGRICRTSKKKKKLKIKMESARSIENPHAFDSQMHVAIKSKDIPTIRRLLRNGDKFCVKSGYCDCFYILKRTNDWNFVKDFLKIDPAFAKDQGHYLLLQYLHQPDVIAYLLIEPFTEKDKQIFIEAIRYCLINMSVPAETLKILLEKGFHLFDYQKDLVCDLTKLCNNEPKTLDSFLKFEMCLKLLDDQPSQFLGLLLDKERFNQNCLLMFKELIKNGVDVDQVNKEKVPLVQAILLKDSGMILECVTDLVEAGANTNVRDTNGNTPLMLAAKIIDPYVCYEVTRVLLKAGATPDNEALRLLCRKQDELVVETIKLFPENSHYTPVLCKALHEQDSDLNVRDHDGNTPLILATQIPDIHEALLTVQHLLGGDADPRLSNNNGDTPLHFAVARDLNMVLVLLHSDADPSVENKQGETPLTVATGIKHIENGFNTISTLIEWEADPDCCDNNGNTPLHLAINFGPHMPEKTILLIQSILNGGADPSAVNKNGETPLHLALKLETNMDVVIKLLLQAGCDVNTRDEKTGFTPLHQAVTYSKSTKTVEILKLLLLTGSDPSKQCLNGNTPLHYACENTTGDENIWFEIITLLIESGSNPNILNEKGENVMFFVVKSKKFCSTYFPQVFKLLLQKGADINVVSSRKKVTPLLACVSENNYPEVVNDSQWILFRENQVKFKIATLLLEAGADVNVEYQSGLTAFAFIRNWDELLIQLFKHGLNPECVDQNRNPAALSIFCKTSHCRPRNLCILINEMRKAGVNFSIMNREGNTPLMLYLKTIIFNRGQSFSQFPISEIVKSLLQANIDLSISNYKNETALLLAVQVVSLDAHGIDCFQLILEAGLNPFMDKNQNIQQILTKAFEINDCEFGPRAVRLILNMWLNSGQDTFQLSNFCFVNAIDGPDNPEVALQNIQHLLEIGANPHEEEARTQFNALDYAVCHSRKNNRHKVVQRLLQVIGPYENHTYELKWSSLVENLIVRNSFPCDRMVPFLKKFKHLFKINESSKSPPSSVIRRFFDYGLNEEPAPDGSISFLLAFLNTPASYFNRAYYKLDTGEEVSSIVKNCIIKSGIDPCQRILNFKDEELQLWSQQLQLPDALWVAAVSGHNQCVCDLLPYWPAHPLALLIFMYPLFTPATITTQRYNKQEMKEKMLLLIPILLKSGPLPPGSPILRKVTDVINAISQRHPHFRHLQSVSDSIQQFRRAHKTIPPLQNLCRVKIRSMFSGGLDLPDRIDTLPIPVSIANWLNFSDFSNPYRVSSHAEPDK